MNPCFSVFCFKVNYSLSIRYSSRLSSDSKNMHTFKVGNIKSDVQHIVFFSILILFAEIGSTLILFSKIIF